MRILVIGSGGREHALAWKLGRSARTSALFIAPGNPGTAACGTNVPLDLADFDAIGRFCLAEKIELVLVGPEEPLVNGLYDHFQADEALRALHFIGPSRQGALLEGSKAFAKAFMQRHGIPTAAYREFTAADYDEGVQYLRDHALPIVLKADGLAAGKGVVICQSHEEALAEFEQMIRQAKFGRASAKVVVEAFLDGIELSVFALTDGRDYVLLPEAKDYKRIGEGDTGLNTGGMGAVSPVPFATPEFMDKVEQQVIRPTVKGLHLEGIAYTGFIFFGLISVQGEPYVIEYNCRMGDPETEVVIPRLENDLVELCLAAATRQLNTIETKASPDAAVTVMAVSKGYPGDYPKGLAITGLEQDYGSRSIIFQAGTRQANGQIVTQGGRVFCVTSFGDSIPEAVAASLQVMEQTGFDGMYYRTDIGYEFKS